MITDPVILEKINYPTISAYCNDHDVELDIEWNRYRSDGYGQLVIQLKDKSMSWFQSKTKLRIYIRTSLDGVVFTCPTRVSYYGPISEQVLSVFLLIIELYKLTEINR